MTRAFELLKKSDNYTILGKASQLTDFKHGRVFSCLFLSWREGPDILAFEKPTSISIFHQREEKREEGRVNDDYLTLLGKCNEIEMALIDGQTWYCSTNINLPCLTASSSCIYYYRVLQHQLALMASLLGFCSVTVLCESNVKLFVAQEYTTPIFQALQLLHGKW